jgi:hypothetical protein
MKRHALNQPGDNYTCLMSSIKNIFPHPGCGDLRLFTAGDSIALLRWFTFCLLLSFSLLARAATVNITAEFSADISQPQRNEFTNTTPMSGFCTELNNVCADGTFSIAVPAITGNKYIDAMTHDYINEWPSVTIDGRSKTITLTEKNTGRIITADFRITFVAMNYTLDHLVSGSVLSMDGLSNRPEGGCQAGNIGSTFNSTSLWGWRVPASKVNCYGRLKSVGSGIPLVSTVNIDNFSLGYSLITPDPLSVYGGIYEGELVYSLGDNGEDIGLHAQTTSDNEIRIHITATVNHAFNLFFPGGSNNLDVKLDAQGGWSQWINGGRIPESLYKEMPFLLTSSTPFVVKMQCGLDGGNQNCGLENTQTHAVEPVEVALTLPGFKSNGADVNKLRITTVPNGLVIDPPGVFIADRRSYLDFRVLRPAVETMVKAPGSTWKGAVTLIFDTQAP